MKRIVAAVIVSFLVACDKPAPPPADTATAVAPTPPPATPAVDPAPSTFKVRFETSKGPIVIQFTREWSPNGVDRVYQLVQANYYDDVRFFRVLPGFIVQFGMHGDPATNSRYVAQPVRDDPVKQTNKRGMVTFAKSMMPDSRTTQLFINVADNGPMLDPPSQQGFAPIGEVIEGMSVVDRLYSEYGEAASQRQPEIAAGGNAFLNREFPKLDFVRTARIVK